MKRFWNFIKNDDNTAELNLYGEIMSEEPWFSEDYVTYRQFIEELDSLGSRDVINVHISSPGGDVFAAHAIFTRLKLNKAKVIAFIEGICASAATIVAMAADVIKIAPNAMYMFHNNKVGLSGYYDSAELIKLAEINKEVKQSIIEAYKSKLNKTEDELNALMEEETWMSGRAAVEQGYADELLFDQVSSVMKGSVVFVNNITKNQIAELNVSKFKNFPQKLLNKTVQADFIDKKNSSKEGNGEEMEIKSTDDLKKAYPDLVDQIITETNDSAIKDERQRLQEIDKLSGLVAEDSMEKAKYVEPMTAKDLALQAMMANNKAGSMALNAMKDDLKNSGTDDVPGGEPEGTSGDDQKNKVNKLAGFLNKDKRRVK